MRLPLESHTSRPWRIHEIASDFTLEDVWALPTPGGPDDFERFLRMVGADREPTQGWSWPARLLWGLRWQIGRLLGWDTPERGIGARVSSLRDRLPADLRDGPTGPVPPRTPFHPVYVTDDELVMEMSNKTVHSVGHYGWVRDGSGGYHAQLAVLVKPNGAFGQLYMAGIRPFRYRIVYAQFLAQISRRWQQTPATSTTEPHHPDGAAT